MPGLGAQSKMEQENEGTIRSTLKYLAWVSPSRFAQKKASTASVIEGSDVKISYILSSFTIHLFKPSQENWIGQKVNMIR